MKPPPPPSPDMNGSTTASVAATATAASTALPPATSAWTPACEARLCADATTPRVPMAGGRNAPSCGPVIVEPRPGVGIVVAIAYLRPGGLVPIETVPPGLLPGRVRDRAGEVTGDRLQVTEVELPLARAQGRGDPAQPRGPMVGREGVRG